jgi:hypothetical protein
MEIDSNKKIKRPISPYGEKLEGLKQYKSYMKEKEDYEKAKNKLNKEEFAKSPLGTTIKYGEKPTDFKARKLPQIQIGENLSREQRFLNDLFGGNRTFGTGNNLPKVDGVLITGGGLINNGDYGETATMFGMRKRMKGGNDKNV